MFIILKLIIFWVSICLIKEYLHLDFSQLGQRLLIYNFVGQCLSIHLVHILNTGFLIEAPDNESGPWFWLKPGRFGWHDETRIWDVDYLLHLDGIHAERGNTVFSAPSLDFIQSSNTSHKIDSLIFFKIFDSKNGVQNKISQHLAVNVGQRTRSVLFLLL